MILAPIPNRYLGRITNRPAVPTTTWGSAVTSSATVNTYGSYVDLLGATTAFETFLMRITAHTIGASAANGDAILTIGIDRAGGTTYVDTISHLIVGGAGTAAMGAIVYEFPLYVPAGARIAAKLSGARASVAGRVLLDMFGKPSAPDQVMAGQYVLTLGANTATSAGTAITPGTSAEGSIVTVATNIARDVWWWQAGVGCNDTTMTGGGLFETLDVGVGLVNTAVDWIITDQVHAAYNTSEQTGMTPLPGNQYVWPVAGGAGVDVFARMAATATPDTGHSVAVYALGG